jgi:hypothetical protein
VCQGIRITRCGYTGEDGFEISVSWKDAQALTDMLLQNSDVKLSGNHREGPLGGVSSPCLMCVHWDHCRGTGKVG